MDLGSRKSVYGDTKCAQIMHMMQLQSILNEYSEYNDKMVVGNGGALTLAIASGNNSGTFQNDSNSNNNKIGSYLYPAPITLDNVSCSVSF